MRWKLFFVLVFISSANQIHSLRPQIGLTPAMGWIPWNSYKCDPFCNPASMECVSERMIKESADLIVSEGYQKAGYKYIILDGCWNSGIRDRNTSELIPYAKLFPNGMKYLADYIHSKGLKFGLYVNEMNYRNFDLDIETYAKWGVDYMKINLISRDLVETYQKFINALDGTGRQILTGCSWPYYHRLSGANINFDVLKKTCNSWRYSHDIRDTWESIRDVIDVSGDIQDEFQPQAGPGHFNNPDMLMIGNPGISINQCRTQMAMWAILAAPLMMTHHLKYALPEIKEILMNKNVLAVNQDPMGIQGRRVMSDMKNEVWIRPVQPVKNGNYSYAVAISSKHESNKPAMISVDFMKYNLTNPGGYHVVDLFSNQVYEYQTNGGNFSVYVMPSGTAFFKFTPIQGADMMHGALKIKTADSSVTPWIVAAICLILVGAGLSYVYVKKYNASVPYVQFAGIQNKLMFWK